jgi:hypothetical protein
VQKIGKGKIGRNWKDYSAIIIFEIEHYLKSPSLTIYKVITNVNLSKIMSTKKTTLI